MEELRVAIFSVDIGSGHKVAGEALVSALSEHRRVEALWVECLDYMGSDGGQFGRNAYFKALEEAPGLWGSMYEERDAYKFFRPFSEMVDRLRVGDLEPDITRFNADIILAVHPFGCGFGAALKRWGLPIPVAAILTDYDAHPGWIANGVDRYFCATSALANRLIREGLPTGSARATGIPLRADFWSDAPSPQSPAELGIDPASPTVLLLGGGMGLGPIEEAASRLTGLPGNHQVVLIAGRNEELEQKARELARTTSRPLHVRGLVSNMRDHMAAADVAVGKPGGLTSSELLAMGTPLVCLDPIPGQEEANARELSAAGAATVARNAADAAGIVRLLLDDPGQMSRMASSAAALGRPDSARTIADRLLRLVEEGPCAPRPPRAVRIANQVERDLERAADGVQRTVNQAVGSVGRAVDDVVDAAEEALGEAGRALEGLFGKFKL